jgi:hypothetical protein
VIAGGASASVVSDETRQRLTDRIERPRSPSSA